MSAPDIRLPSEASVGSTLAGRFRIERVLGAGGMGAVLEATRLETGVAVAVKLLLGDGLASPEAQARFEREARLAARLESEHVVQILDFDRTPSGVPFIVMERLEGRDLAQVIDGPGTLAVTEAVDLVAQACRGVAAAHAAGLVHRDLKPSNLFLARLGDGSEIVKVLDFGLSKAPAGEDASMTGSLVSFGTPQYMSPEQIESTKHVDARCDQHALGMILFELLTKRTAYVAASGPAVMVAICTHPPPRAAELRPDVPTELDAVIVRALAKRPVDRHRDLGALLAALEPFGSRVTRRAARDVRAMLDQALGAPTTESDDEARATVKRVTPAESDDTRATFVLVRAPGDDARETLVLARSVKPSRTKHLAVAGAIAVGLVAGLALALRDEPTVAAPEAGSAPAATAAVGAAPPGPAGEATSTAALPSPDPTSAATGAPGRPPKNPRRTSAGRAGAGTSGASAVPDAKKPVDPVEVFGANR